MIPFTFDEDSHVYHVPGRYVLSTSDVIDMAGLSNMDQVPAAQLAWASHRGTVLHKAVEEYEMGGDWQAAFDANFMPYLEGYFSFRDDYAIQVLPPMEKQYVYEHEGTEQLIGATIDLRFVLDRWLYIADVKSIYPVCGKALRLKQLAWRLQTQSYQEATEADGEFLTRLGEDAYDGIRRAIIHIHPKLKGGYTFYRPEMDDALLWDGAVRLAMEKIACGEKPMKRERKEAQAKPLKEQLRRSVEMEDDGTMLTDADLPDSWKELMKR